MELLELHSLGILQQCSNLIFFKIILIDYNANITKIIHIFFKITLTKVSDANVYIYKQFYISFKIILNKKFLAFESTRLVLSWINLLQMGKFAKAQILGWKLGRKVKLKVTGAQPEIFRGKTGFLEQKHFDKHFMHEIRKNGSAGETFLVFSSRYS